MGSRRVVPDRSICYDQIRFAEKDATRGEMFGAGMRRALSLAVAVTTFAGTAWLIGPADATAAPKACGDFLAEVRRKPNGFIFIDCKTLPERQGRPLRATYRVAGKQAAAVEATLNRVTGLALLRRSCCQWDGPAGSFTDAAGRQYMISMVSDETTVTDRRQWSVIPAFIVTIDRFTEEI